MPLCVELRLAVVMRPLMEPGCGRLILNAQEYHGNLGDTGWGPYCIESGWTQAIILVGLLMAELILV